MKNLSEDKIYRTKLNIHYLYKYSFEKVRITECINFKE